MTDQQQDDLFQPRPILGDTEAPPVIPQANAPHIELPHSNRLSLKRSGRFDQRIVKSAAAVIGVAAAGLVALVVALPSPSDEVEAAGISYAFAPQVFSNGTVMTKQWTLDPADNQIDAQLSVHNTSATSPVSGSHFEVFPASLAPDFASVEFTPPADETLAESAAARFDFVDLEPGKAMDVSYSVPAPADIESFADLKKLATDQLAAEQSFFEAVEQDAPELADLELASIEIEPSAIATIVGDAPIQLRLAGVMSDDAAATCKVLAQAAWSSVDPTVARITPDGQLLAIGAGSTVVTARIGELVSTAAVSVEREQSNSKVASPTAQTDPGAVDTSTEVAPETTSEPSTTANVTSSTAPNQPSSTGSESTLQTVTVLETSTTVELKPSSTSSTAATTTESEGPVTWSSPTTSVTETTATVSFTTSHCTTARYYGRGLSHSSAGWPNANTRCWTAHAHTFENLDPNTSYGIQIDLRNRNGESYTTAPVTFRTREPADVVIPDVSGKSQSAATAQLAASGFKNVSVNTEASSVTKGQAIRTYPAAGVPIPTNLIVVLYVSSGPVAPDSSTTPSTTEPTTTTTTTTTATEPTVAVAPTETDTGTSAEVELQPATTVQGEQTSSS